MAEFDPWSSYEVGLGGDWQLHEFSRFLSKLDTLYSTTLMIDSLHDNPSYEISEKFFDTIANRGRYRVFHLLYSSQRFLKPDQRIRVKSIEVHSPGILDIAAISSAMTMTLALAFGALKLWRDFHRTRNFASLSKLKRSISDRLSHTITEQQDLPDIGSLQLQQYLDFINFDPDFARKIQAGVRTVSGSPNRQTAEVAKTLTHHGLELAELQSLGKIRLPINDNEQ